jgi:hypothetical protein
MVPRLRQGHILRHAADDDAHLAFPVDLRAALRDPNRFSLADHRRGSLQEHVRVPPGVAGLPLPDARRARRVRERVSRRGGGASPRLRRRARTGRTGVTPHHLFAVLAVVHRGIENRRRIHDRRQRFHGSELMEVRRARPWRHGRRHDGHDARAQARLVARDQVFHVGRHGHPLAGRRHHLVGGGQIDHLRVLQDDADEGASLHLEGADLVGRRRLCGGERAGQAGSGEQGEQHALHGQLLRKSQPVNVFINL